MNNDRTDDNGIERNAFHVDDVTFDVRRDKEGMPASLGYDYDRGWVILMEIEPD